MAFVWGARMRRCTAYMTDNIGQTAAVTLEQHHPSYSRNSHSMQKSLWRPTSNVLYDHSCTNPPRASPRTRTYGYYVGCSAGHVMCLHPVQQHRSSQPPANGPDDWEMHERAAAFQSGEGGHVWRALNTEARKGARSVRSLCGAMI